MKLTSLLLGIAVVISFLAGKFYFTIKDSIESVEFDQREVTHVIAEFINVTKPSKTISLPEFFPSVYQYSKGGWSRIIQKSLSSSNIDYASKQSCKVNSIPLLLDARAQQKLQLWMQYICNSTPVTENFFTEPPYIHPSGASYIYLATNSPNSDYQKEQWIKKHLSYLEITEFPQLLEEYPTLLNDTKFDWLKDSSEDQLDMLRSGTTFFMMGNNLVVQDRSLSQQFLDILFTFNDQGQDRKILLYNSDLLHSFFRKTHFRVSTYDGKKSCLIKQNNICWNYSLLYFFHYASTTTLTVLGLTFLILAIVLWQILKRIKEDKKEEHNRRLALQILTHEFRTPIASLILQSELINNQNDTIPPHFEEHWSEISTNIYRLQRLTEMSKNYLQVSRKGQFHLNPTNVTSLNDLLADIVDEFEIEDQKISYLSHDREAELDIFWFRLILKNLIENAKRYGVMPLEVSLHHRSNDLWITVKDQGNCPLKSLKELTTEFNKADNSPGIGLGLNIVAGAIRGMGGELLFQHSPTTFTVHLKGILK